MKIEDEGILLGLRPFGESSHIVTVFTKEHGLYSGMTRGVQGKAKRGVFQPFNLVAMTWNARLAEQMGSINAEMLEAYAARLMHSQVALAAATSACALVSLSLPEREAHPGLYAALLELIQALGAGEEWAEMYVHFELTLLREAGYRLDLTHCAATGRTEELVYVSPKSGRAVSRAAGEPYRDRLLPLPGFLITPSPPGGGKFIREEILAALRLTGYFLAHWLLEPHGRTLPAARQRLIHSLQKS